MKNLHHPFIPEIYDLEEDESFLYIIEEYIPGESLRALCKHRLLSEKEIFQFIIQISSIISYLHSMPQKIIYLDLKPENIIVNGENCYLIDFGSARPEGSKEKMFLGSKGFAAPEQKQGQEIRTESDIYALGKLLEYLVSHSICSSKTKTGLNRLIAAATEPKFWNRIGTASDFMVRLKEMQKNIVATEEKQIRLAITGAHENIGVTYVSLLFCAFLEATVGKCAYVETSDSEIWKQLDRDYVAKNFPQLEFTDCKSYESGNFPSCNLVIDYGPYKKNMPADFHEADCVCILVDKMAWGKKELLQVRALSQDCTNRLFLVNLTDCVSDDIAYLLKGEKIAAVPFVQNPGDVVADTVLRDIFAKILSRCGKDSYVQSHK